MKTLGIIMCLIATLQAVDITVDISEGKRLISPALYGRNNNIRTGSNATSETDKQLFREAGLRLMRENNGNNSTKFNWRNGLSSHPDWYNNVYAQDWDGKAKMIEEEFDNTFAMFGFPVSGWAASSDSANFKEWINDPSFLKTTENLCGGGDINKYLTPWPADSVVGILDHWFGPEGLGFTESRFVYWNLDNEPDIWEHTHDDVYPEHVHPDVIIDKYLAVARKVKEVNPNIKLCGPAFTGEWHFWGWGLEDDLGMSGAEYFIKRFGEATTEDGVQLIDMIDLHFYFDYPQTAKEKTDFLQYYRVFYDENYAYPKGNGVKSSEGGWDITLDKEYLMKRVEGWIEDYFPENNTVTLGMSEAGFKNGSNADPNYVASWYASLLGSFADNGTELFSPWYWYAGQWEVLSLFSNYHLDTRVSSISDNDSLVSAYSAINDHGDSLSVILVNRDEVNSQTVTLSLENAKLLSGTDLQVHTLSNLPTTETFISRSNNALVEGSLGFSADSLIEISLKPLSITRVGAKIKATVAIEANSMVKEKASLSFQNKQLKISELTQNSEVSLVNFRGQKIFTKKNVLGSFSKELKGLSAGLYLVQVRSINGATTQSVMVQ